MIWNSGVFFPDPNTHLYLWVTNNFLTDGLWLMGKLAFRYITNIVRVKDRYGLGYYFRGKHELCLFGVKGTLRTKNRSISTVIQARRRAHSQKPEEMYELIETQSYPPRLEMFSRRLRDGWDSWGDEVKRIREKLPGTLGEYS